jgi:hypothetical protein
MQGQSIFMGLATLEATGSNPGPGEITKIVKGKMGILTHEVTSSSQNSAGLSQCKKFSIDLECC